MSTTSGQVGERQALRVRPARRLTGVVSVPGDKSISHRALMLAAVSDGESRIANLGTGADILTTQKLLADLGVRFSPDGALVVVHGVGRDGFAAAPRPLDCGNSGTTMRLFAGLLAGGPHGYTLTGDASLRRRPMKRIAEPLRKMGVDVQLGDGDLPPVRICGGRLRPIEYTLEVPSAQVKSAILLAALHADGITRIHEIVPSRDHTEIMLGHLGAGIKVEPVIEEVESTDPRRRGGARRTDEREILLHGPCTLKGADFNIPGDFSTAAYFLAAGLLVRRSDIRIPDVGANPLRTGLAAVLSTMGARLNWHKRRTVDGEPVGELHIGYAALSARKVSGRLIPRLIDELPVLAVLATQAEGTTIIRDAGELRHKESDRLELVAENLKRMGAKIATLEDGWAIEGPTALSAAQITTGGDHRMAMAFAVAALAADGETEIDDAGCVRVSCPGFFDMLDALR